MGTERDLNDLQAFVVAGKSGDYVFRQGDEGAELYLLRQGRVELIDESQSPAATQVVLSAGDVFGERQAFAPGPRTVSARGATEFQALRIDRDTLAKMAAEDADVAVGFIERLAMRAPAAPAPPPAPTPTPEPPAPAPAPEPAAPTGTPCLVVAAGDATFGLTDEELVVGRPDRSSGFVPGIDLSPYDEERSLSRRHARVRVEDGRVLVCEERGARNGTFVDGQRVETGIDVELRPGMTVRFGLVDTVFDYRDDV